MFRRKETEFAPLSGQTEPRPEVTYPRPVAEPRAQPELPRRSAVDLPIAPVAAAERPGEPPARHTEADKKQLIVGQGISLSGEITACDRLVVLGNVQVTLNQTRSIEIAETGRFTNGRAEVEEAEISGVYEGELTVRKRLLIRSTGQVKGNVRYGELQIEQGGRISGSIAMLTEAGSLRAAEPPAEAA